MVLTNLELKLNLNLSDEHDDNHEKGHLGREGRGDDNVDTKPWIIAFLDRTCRPETEGWVFASWENEETQRFTLESGKASRSIETTTRDDDDYDDEEEEEKQKLVLAFVKAMKNLGPLPISIYHRGFLDEQDTSSFKENNDDDNNNSREKDGISSLSSITPSSFSSRGHILLKNTHDDPNIILFGAVHSSTTQILNRLGLIKRVFGPRLVPCHTYLFELPLRTEKAKGLDILPQGLRWGELRPEYFPIVGARTEIPRRARMLADLPSLAIYEDGPMEKPIAWVFVGLDGSLTALHVEKAWRGKGLAKAIALKLWREKMGRFWEEGVTRWAHDYVVEGNTASVATSESLGGKWIGDTFWVRLDLGRVD